MAKITEVQRAEVTLETLIDIINGWKDGEYKKEVLYSLREIDLDQLFYHLEEDDLT